MCCREQTLAKHCKSKKNIIMDLKKIKSYVKLIFYQVAIETIKTTFIERIKLMVDDDIFMLKIN